MVDQVPPLAIRHLRGTHPPVEVDVLQHPLQSAIAVLERSERLVQPIAHLMVHLVPQVRPTSLRRHKERLLVEVGIIGSQFGIPFRAPPPDLGLHDPPPLLLEHITGPLQEQRPEDVLLELRRIHLPPQDVSSGKQMPFKLWKREHTTRLRCRTVCCGSSAMGGQEPRTEPSNAGCATLNGLTPRRKPERPQTLT